VTRVLAIDASTWWGGVALVERQGGRPRIVAELGLAVEVTHADRMLGRVELLLAEAGWSRDSPDGYVATRGPGSFTGIRVALGTIRGLALASGRGCAGVGTLDALVEAHGPSDRVRVAAMEAGRGELYVGAFDAEASPPEPLDQPRLVSRSALQHLEAATPLLIVPAPGTELAPEELPLRARLAPAPRTLAAAAGAIALAAGLDRTGEATLAPLYVRPPDAVVKRRN
jgi:tRNA threonylcarbamoyladenosine biosynthesis protein TsaB